MSVERTFVLIKPDGVERGLVGEIIRRFERAGLMIERIELFRATADLINEHYPNDEGWLKSVGEKTLDAYDRDGLDAKEFLGAADALSIGKIVKSWLAEYMTSGPVIAVVLSCNRAVEKTRKLVGHTFPSMAEPGTIRGDFGADSPEVANGERRSVKNLVHASGDVDEARREIGLWFKN